MAENTAVGQHGGQVLQAAMKKVELTVYEVAGFSGIETRYLESIIEGMAPLTPETAAKLARVEKLVAVIPARDLAGAHAAWHTDMLLAGKKIPYQGGAPTRGRTRKAKS